MFGASCYVNYVDGYSDNISEPGRTIDSWTTVDLQARVDLEGGAELLDGVSVALNVQNALDEEPPFFNNSAGIAYDSTNASLIGRVISLQVRKAW